MRLNIELAFLTWHSIMFREYSQQHFLMHPVDHFSGEDRTEILRKFVTSAVLQAAWTLTRISYTAPQRLFMAPAAVAI